MSIGGTIRNTLVPVHREGYPFIAICAGGTLLLFVLGSPFAWLVLGIGVWVAYFFRDPSRVTPVRSGLVVSAADGRISFVGDAVPPPELGLGTEPLPRVSVFMNIFNVHVNRTPITGHIARMVYKPGKFLNAELDKASEHNERNSLLIEDASGARIGVVQIAGLVARRIVAFVHDHETVTAGDRIGLIRFGSRVDIFLPKGITPLVAVGQNAIAGETIIADMSSNATLEAGRTYRVG